MWLLLLPVPLFLFYLYRKSQQAFFKNLGIPGPEPNWFFGNLLSYNENYPQILWMKDCTRKYGKMWGFFEGPTPCLVVSDPKLVQEALVKKFSSFHARKLPVLAENPKSAKMINMFNAQGDRWKRLRTIVNPAFSEARLREMFPLIKKCTDVLMCQFSEHCSKGDFFDAYDLYKRFTLEVIGECAFGVALNSQRDDRSDSVFSKVNFLFSLIGRRPFLIVLAEAFPPLALFVRKFFRLLVHVLPSRAKGLQLRRQVAAVIEDRRENVFLGRTDLLQLMLDAELPAEFAAADEPGQKSLSTEEVISQSMLFLIVGYETSSTVLGLVTHLLATHPDVQRRVQLEIDELYDSCENPALLEVSCGHLSGLHFLNQVILEALRLYPVGAGAMNRRCPSSGELTCGVCLPAGANLLCDVLSMHCDPAVWGPVDPDSFDPERFAASAHREAFLGFGAGPRSCIGRRFALTEIRAVLFRLLRHFSIRAAAERLQLNFASTIRPAGAVRVRLEPRNTPAVPNGPLNESKLN